MKEHGEAHDELMISAANIASLKHININQINCCDLLNPQIGNCSSFGYYT